MNNVTLGVHVHGGIDKVVHTLDDLRGNLVQPKRLNSAQIFISTRTGKLSKIDISVARKITKKVDMFVHSSYVTSAALRDVAAPDGKYGGSNSISDGDDDLDSHSTIIGSGASPVVFFNTKSATAIAKREYDLAADMKCKGYVLHFPSTHYSGDDGDDGDNGDDFRRRSSSESLVKIMEGTTYQHQHKPPVIFAEISAHRDEINRANTPEKLADILSAWEDEMDAKYFNNVGICIDTAHLYASGIDISKKADAENWLAQYDDEVRSRFDVPTLIHLNDAENALGSGHDVHSDLFGGAMWGQWKSAPKKSGLAAFLSWAEETNTVCILERNSTSPERDLAMLAADFNL